MRTLLLLSVVLAITGCTSLSRIGYRTTTQHTPFLTEAGEVKAQGGFAFNHSEMIVAVSPIKHVGFLGNYYSQKFGNSRDFGIGAYNKWGSSFITEAYFILGDSRYNQSKRDTINVYMSEEERVYIGDVSFDYKKRGLQLNLAYTYKQVKIGVGLNWQHVDYRNYSLQEQWYSKEDYYHQRFILESDESVYFGNQKFDVLTIAPTIQYTFLGFYVQHQFCISKLMDPVDDMPYPSVFMPKHLLSTTLGWHFVPSTFRALKSKI